MLELQNATIVFNPNTVNERVALRRVNFTLNDGDFVTVIGSNGAGKSTLLNAISGTYPLTGGHVLLDGKDMTRLPEHKRARYIGRLFQDPLKGTAPNMTIEENLGLAFSRGSRRGLSLGVKRADREQFREILRSLDLGLEDRMKTRVGSLSGGQRQALTLLMATIVTPSLLLLDEHTAALDPKTSKQIMELTEQIVHKHHITTLMVTHNIQNALEYGNKTLVLSQGKLILQLDGEQRANLSVEDLMRLYNANAADVLSDRMVL